MAFWLLRGVLATLAVVATLVPASAAAYHAFQVVEVEAERDRMRDDAGRDLLLFQTEYALEAAIVAAKPDDTKRFFSVRLEEAQIYWTFARLEFEQDHYASMRANIGYARLALAGNGAAVPDPRETGPNAVDRVEDPVLQYDIAAGGALASLLLWSIWGGMTRRPMPVLPVPVYPGEVEVERKEPEAPPKTSLPGLPGGPDDDRTERRARRASRSDAAKEPRRASWTVTPSTNGAAGHTSDRPTPAPTAPAALPAGNATAPPAASKAAASEPTAASPPEPAVIEARRAEESEREPAKGHKAAREEERAT
jgi:hypothetical protein